jgi:hypothetical protein
MMLENASCITDEKPRALEDSPMILRTDLDAAESMFFDEVPPHDGHRRNILKPSHTRVAIGIAVPQGTPPCIVQEFIDELGTYDPLPPTAKVGQRVTVAGVLGEDGAATPSPHRIKPTGARASSRPSPSRSMASAFAPTFPSRKGASPVSTRSAFGHASAARRRTSW